MAYRLKASESVRENIRRIVSEEIDSAIGHLHTRGVKKRDEAVHEARKSIKKIRGVLKLIRPQFGRTYKIENEALRTIGNTLSGLRDAGVLLETASAMAEKSADKQQTRALSKICKALQQSKREKSLDAGNVMRAAATGLLGIRGRVPEWPLEAEEVGTIAQGLKESYREGRKAMAEAAQSSKPEMLHEWRKRVKDHWYHVRLLEGLWTGVIDKREESLHELETWLGEDHNVFVLLEQVKSNPKRFGSGEELDLLLALAGEMQVELRQKSFAAGERLYAEKPKHMVRRFAKLWEEWKAESLKPKSPSPA